MPPLPAELYVPLLQAVLLPWGEGPTPPSSSASASASSSLSSSLPARLAKCDALASALGMTPAAHQQAMVAALEGNRWLGPELRRRATAVQAGLTPGVTEGDPALSQVREAGGKRGGRKGAKGVRAVAVQAGLTPGAAEGDPALSQVRR